MPQEGCSYFSPSSDAYDETSPEQSAWTIRHCYGNLSEKLQQEIFVIIKEKDWKLPSARMTSNAIFSNILLYAFIK